MYNRYYCPYCKRCLIKRQDLANRDDIYICVKCCKRFKLNKDFEVEFVGWIKMDIDVLPLKVDEVYYIYYRDIKTKKIELVDTVGHSNGWNGIAIVKVKRKSDFD